MAGKIFEIAFRISGALNSQFASSMRMAQSSMQSLSAATARNNAVMSGAGRGLQSYLVNLNRLSASAENFIRLKQAVTESNTALRQAQERANQLASAYRQQQQASSQLKTKVDQLKASYEAQKNSLPKEALRALRNELKTATAEWKAQEQAARAAAREFESAKAKAAGLKTALQSQNAALHNERTALSQAGISAGNLAERQRALRSEIERTTHALEAQARANAAMAANNAAQANMFNAYGNFQGAMNNAQTMIRPLAVAVDGAMEFEHAMSRVKALTQSGLIREGNLEAVSANMHKLEEQAKQLGSTTQFTMTQAAEAMGYLGMAGWKTEQIYGTLPGMLNLAAGAGTDLARTADIVSDNMTAMGVPVEKAGHFMDVYAYALSNANVDLEALGETMKYAAPIASAFGASLEDTAAMTMMMGNAGIKGSMAGTALRMGLLRLSGPPKKASKEMEALGISVSDATAMALESQAALQSLGIEFNENAPPMEKMSNIITQLQTKLSGLSREEKLSAVSAIFGANAASGWVNIIEQGGDTFDQFRDALRNSDGYAKQLADTMNDDTKGAMIALESSLDSVGKAVGSAFLPALRSAAEWLTPMATALSGWIGNNKEIVVGIGVLIGALAGTMVAVSGVQMAFAGWSFISSTITLVRTQFTALTSIVSSAGGTFAGTMARARAAALAFQTSVTSSFATMRALTWSQVGANISAAFTAARAGVSSAMSFIVAQANAARLATMRFFTSLSISGALSTASTAIRGVGTAFMVAARGAMAFVLTPLGAVLMAIAAAAYYVYTNWDRLAPMFQNMASQIQAALQGAWTAIQPAIETMRAAFDNMIASVLPALQAAWASVGEAISSNSGVFSLIAGVLGTIASIVGGALVGSFVMFANVLTGVVVTAVNMTSATIVMIIEVIQGIIDFVTNVFTGQWSAAWENVVSIFSSIFSGIGKIASSVLDGIISTVSNIGNSIKGLAGLGGGGSSIASNAEGGIYRKGAFITTFAEDSAEAAIPLDGSERAVSLWQKAGEMLGILPDTQPGLQDNSPIFGMNVPDIGLPEIVRQNTSPSFGSIPELSMPKVEASAPSYMPAPPINVSITINGNADAEEVERGVRDGMASAWDSFAEQYAAFRHEQRRVSFA